jgi:peptidoglycan/LPS O-acetylase OafA/YrhL
MMTKRFHALDSARGLLAITVAAFHFPFLTHLTNLDLFEHTDLWVDMFFVLSGFVMTHVYLDRVNDRADLQDFLSRRFGRIYPLHLLTLLALLAIQLGGMALDLFEGHQPEPMTGSYDLAALVPQLLLLNSVNLTSDLTWNIPAWSIGAEFYTYLVFAGVIFLAGRWLPWVSAAVAVAATAIILACSPYIGGITSDYGFYRCLIGFFLGVLGYLGYRRLAGLSALSRAQVTGIEVLTLAAAVAFVWLCPLDWPALFAPVLFTFVVLAFSRGDGLLGRLLELPVLQHLGKISYSIYLTHTVLIDLVYPSLDALVETGLVGYRRGPEAEDLLWLGSKFTDDLGLLVYLAAIIAVSTLTYRFVELPGQQLVRRWSRPRLPQPAPAPSEAAA